METRLNVIDECRRAQTPTMVTGPEEAPRLRNSPGMRMPPRKVVRVPVHDPVGTFR